MILLSSSLDSFIQLVGVIVVFVLILILTYFTTKWIGGFQKAQMAGRSFQVIDTIRIAGGKYIQVLKMGDVYLVVAVGKDTVTLLAQLTENEIGLTEEQMINAGQSAGTPSGVATQETFQEILEKIKGHFPKKQD